MDCSIVIPPTEIQNEAMLTSIISFQKKLLQDRSQGSDSTPCLESKPRRGKCYNKPIICWNSFLLSVHSAHIRLKLSPVSISSGPPPEDPLSRTGRPFGGMIRDIKKRYQYYKSDITDALNAQVLAAVIFIYFAALSPAITFGGLLGMCVFVTWYYYSMQ